MIRSPSLFLRPGRNHFTRVVVLIVLTLGVAWLPALAEAGDTPAGKKKLGPSLLPSLSSLRQQFAKLPEPEIVEMIRAIAGGSQMGPGEGWFHGSQTRFGWKWLAARFDANHDGSISREEFKGPPELFDRLDRNRDGALTSSDFDWAERSLFAMQSMPASFWFRALDSNSNGRVSREEWVEFFAKISKGKEYLTPDDLREAFPVAPPPRPAGQKRPAASDGPSPLVLMLGLLSGELGSFFEGPSLGQRAPDFTLPTQDGKRRIRLSQFRGQKPVVLVFGSFT